MVRGCGVLFEKWPSSQWESVELRASGEEAPNAPSSRRVAATFRSGGGRQRRVVMSYIHSVTFAGVHFGRNWVLL